MKATLHGSMRKYYDTFCKTKDLFEKVGVEIIAPQIGEVLKNEDGFVYSKGDDVSQSPIQIENDFIKKSLTMSDENFAYYINPDGYIGKSGATELAFLMANQIRVIFMEPFKDPPLPYRKNSIYTPEELAKYIKANGHYPNVEIDENSQFLYNLTKPKKSSGGILLPNYGNSDEIGLIYRDSRDNGKYTLLGASQKNGEGRSTIEQIIKHAMKEQIGLDNYGVGELICDFNEIQDAGYHNAHIYRNFTDFVINIGDKPKHTPFPVLWTSLEEAMQMKSEIEPNAYNTLSIYNEQLRHKKEIA